MYILLAVACPISFIPNSQRMDGFLFAPLVPVGRIFSQRIASQDAITRGVLNIDVQVMTLHGNYDIKIDLQGMGNTMFDGISM